MPAEELKKCKHGTLRRFECSLCRVPLTEEGRAFLVAEERANRELAQRRKPVPTFTLVAIDAGIEVPPNPRPEPITFHGAEPRGLTPEPQKPPKPMAHKRSDARSLFKKLFATVGKEILTGKGRKLPRALLKVAPAAKVEERRVRIRILPRNPVILTPVSKDPVDQPEPLTTKRVGRPPDGPEKVFRDFFEELEKAILGSPKKKLTKAMLKVKRTPEPQERRVRIFAREQRSSLLDSWVAVVPPKSAKKRGRPAKVVIMVPPKEKEAVPPLRWHDLHQEPGAKPRSSKRRFRPYPLRARA